MMASKKNMEALLKNMGVATSEQPEAKEEVKAEVPANEAEKKSKPDKPKKYFINIDLTGYKGYLANMASVNETTINGYVRSLVEADANKPENKELNEALEKFKAVKGKK